MSDYDEYDGNSDEEEPKPKPNWRRKLETDAEEGRRAQAERDQAQRELAFYKAGLPLDQDPRLGYFVKGYDGPLDAAAIKQAAAEAGFIQAEQSAYSSELADQRAFTDASAGAAVNPSKTQADVLVDARKAADAAPAHLRAQVYAEELAKAGYGQMQRPPS